LVLIEFVKFTAQLILALVLLRLVQVRSQGTALGDALAFVNT
jgi:hypothetical protein